MHPLTPRWPIGPPDMDRARVPPKPYLSHADQDVTLTIGSFGLNVGQLLMISGLFQGQYLVPANYRVAPLIGKIQQYQKTVTNCSFINLKNLRFVFLVPEWLLKILLFNNVGKIIYRTFTVRVILPC